MFRLPPRLLPAVFAALCGCLVYLLGAMSRVAVPGMVFETLRADYGFTTAQIALLPSAGVFGCLAFIGVSGVLVDRFGWARLLLAGALVQALGYIPVHECRSLPWMLAGEFVNGGGRTIVYLAILKLFDVSFPRRNFAALIGVFYIFSYGGTLGASEFYPWLVKTYGSWQLATRAINYGTLAGALGLVLLLPCLPLGTAVGGTVRRGFPWREMGTFLDVRAASALLAAGLNIAVYWSFLTVSAGPYARTIGTPQYLGQMNGIVMAGMVGMGSVSLLFRNARRPFFLWGSFAIAAAFGAFLLGHPHAGFLLLGAGYGVTSVLLAGTKESVSVVFAASAIGFTNFFANIVQIGANQASGALMGAGTDGYPRIFTLYLLLALVSCGAALSYACRPSRGTDK